IEVDKTVQRWLTVENNRRAGQLQLVESLIAKDPTLARDPVVSRWRGELQPLPQPLPTLGTRLSVHRVPADPAFSSARIAWEEAHKLRTPADKYGYPRAFANSPVFTAPSGMVVLDPSAGGGAIPFEAMRLGHRVV